MTTKIYLVGGAVRDHLLGVSYHKKEKDWVVIGSTPEEMIQNNFIPVGKDFPVFLHPKTHEEYALARSEKKIGKGYKGFDFYTSPNITLEQDLARRDLTINAMAMDPETGQIIDPYHGQKDLKEKILRHVSNAFVEDPVRILRIARFMARFKYLGFHVANETLELMQTMVKQGEVDALVRDRVWHETEKALSERSPKIFFEVLEQCHALDKLFPELKNIHQVHLPELNDKKWNPRLKSLIYFVLILLQCGLQSEEIRCLCERYPIPVEYRELAFTANVIQKYFFQKELSPEKLLEILEKSDAYRRKERFDLLLQVFELFGNKHIDLLRQAFIMTEKVEIKRLIEEGVTGYKLGERIKEIRLELLKGRLLHK